MMVVHKKKRAHKRILFLVISGVLIAGSVFLVWMLFWRSIPSFVELSYGEKIEYIRDMIRREGPLGAKDFLLRTYSDDASMGHHLMHVVGEELYYQFPDDAFALCDNTFNFGCFHGAIVGYIERHALDWQGIIQFTRDGCMRFDTIEKSSACYHGVGHALFDVKGDLGEAMELCKEMAGEQYNQSCFEGVAMERAVGSFRNGEKDEHVISVEEIYSMCLGLKQEFREACLTEHVAYVLIDLAPSDWEKAGEYCEQIPGAAQLLLTHCGNRIGTAVHGITGGDLSRGWEICKKTGALASACAYGLAGQRIAYGDTSAGAYFCGVLSGVKNSCLDDMREIEDRVKRVRLKMGGVDN